MIKKIIELVDKPKYCHHCGKEIENNDYPCEMCNGFMFWE